MIDATDKKKILHHIMMFLARPLIKIMIDGTQ